MVMLASCYAGVAHAEMASGTVTSIDAAGQSFTLKRADTNGMMTVHVANKALLNNFQQGIGLIRLG